MLSGEHEFYRYLKRSKSDDKQAVGAKYALLGPLALIDDGVHAILPHEITYNEAEYKDSQLQKPKYRNKNVNMDELFRLIEEIRGTCVDSSIEHRLSSSILGANTEN